MSIVTELKRIDQRHTQPDPTIQEWSNSQKNAFRIAFIYFFVQAVPLDWKYYKLVFSINWLELSYGDIFNLARYSPAFFSGGDTFANWLVILVLAVAGAVIWGLRDKGKKEYNNLYYWLRVVVRYRLAVGLLAYGFIKFFPLQAPEPSLSNLNTTYGDLNAWKIFSLSLGVVPGYESFLGFIEILGGLLLLNRRTTTLATLIIIPFAGNVFISNLAYEGGEYVYSLYLIAFAFFLFAYDANRLFILLTLECPTAPNRFQPVFQRTWEKYGRHVLKTAFILFFVVIYAFKTYAGYHVGSYQYPQMPGLANAAGLYNVREFRIKNQVLPYAALDPVRWKDVVFENWATLSIRSNRPVAIDSSNTEQIYKNDADRNYEELGSAGRHFYSYVQDPAKQTLTLTNKVKPAEKLVLNYTRPDSRTIILSGIDENRDSIYVVLDKREKKYLYQEVQKVGRRGEFKL